MGNIKTVLQTIAVQHSFIFPVACILVGIAGWYVISAFTYGMSSGQLGRHAYLYPFQCFLEDLPCYLPFGRKYREEFIRSRTHGSGIMCGRKKAYSFDEIRKNNLYNEVFYQMCGTHSDFYISHLGRFLFGWIFLGIGITLLIATAIIWFGAWCLGFEKSQEFSL